MIAACVRPQEIGYAAAGSIRTSSRSSPLALRVALKTSDRSMLEVGTSCALPVRAARISLGRGEAPEHTFSLDAGSVVSCCIGERALSIRQASGTEGQGGLIDAHLAGTDADGKLVVIDLHGNESDRRYLDMAPAPSDRVSETSSSTP